MDGKDWGDATAFPCCCCERPLFLLPVSRPLLFQCENGHSCSAGDLLRKWLPEDRPESSATLQRWESRVDGLLSLAQSCGTHGQIQIAADLHETARVLTERIQALRAFLYRWQFQIARLLPRRGR